MRLLAVAAAVSLCACAFSSEGDLFPLSAAAHPIADGARFEWRPVPTGPSDVLNVTFRRDAQSYRIEERTHPDQPLNGVLFVAIEATPEEDYVAQLRMRPDDEQVVYAFLWRTPHGFRAFIDPIGGDSAGEMPDAARNFCRISPYNECVLARREDVLGYYRSLIYPRFVAGAQTPSAYLDLIATDAPEKGAT